MSLINFQTELTTLLNKHSIDNDCNTPDFILAGNICLQIMATQAMMKDRDTWFRKSEEAEGKPEESLIDPMSLIPKNG